MGQSPPPGGEGGRSGSLWSKNQDVICCECSSTLSPARAPTRPQIAPPEVPRGRALRGADSPTSQEGAGGDSALGVPRQGTERPRGVGSLPSLTPGGPWSPGGVSRGSGLGALSASLGSAKAEHFPVTEPRPQHRSAMRPGRGSLAVAGGVRLGLDPGGPAPGVQGLLDPPGLRDTVN